MQSPCLDTLFYTIRPVLYRAKKQDFHPFFGAVGKFPRVGKRIVDFVGEFG